MFFNVLKVGMLLAVMTAIFVGMGALIGGEVGMIIAFVIVVFHTGVNWGALFRGYFTFQIPEVDGAIIVILGAFALGWLGFKWYTL